MVIVGLMAAVSLLDTPMSLTNPFVFIQLQRGGDICTYLKGGTTLFIVMRCRVRCAPFAELFIGPGSSVPRCTASACVPVQPAGPSEWVGGV